MAAGDSSFLFREGIIPGPDDVVIAILGETGSGKSAFVSLCTGGGSAEVGDDLASCTQEMTTFDFMHGGRRVFLVDTPGFDDSERSDADILRTLSHWFTETYAHYNIRLSGLIYLHRINQPRMRGSALKRTALFKKLCGDNALKKVVLVTTFWDLEKQHVAEKRHDELAQNKQYWGDMINRGSEVFKHDNTKSSAEAVVDFFARQDTKVTLAIQEEMVYKGKNLNQTGAGQNVEALLAEQEARIRRDLEDIVKEMRDAARQRDLEMAEMMKELKAQHSEDLDRVMKSNEKLQISMQKLHEEKLAQSAEEQMSRRIPSPPPEPLPKDDPTSKNQQIIEPAERQPEEMRVRQALKGHSSRVNSVAFAPDGRKLASASLDNTVKIWDAVSGRCDLTLWGHASFVCSVAFAPDGSKLASASNDNTVKFWDAVSGWCQQTLKGHHRCVNSVAFSPDGSYLASAGDDSIIIVWDISSGACQWMLEGHTGSVLSVAFAPNGRQLASASSDGTVKIWDTASGECKRTLKGHNLTVYSVAFAPDGPYLVSGSIDKTVKIWDAASGVCGQTLKGHGYWVNSVAFAPDGRKVVSASLDNTVKVWDMKTGLCQQTLRCPVYPMDAGNIHSLHAIFAPDGRQLVWASINATVKIWEISGTEP